MILNKIVFNNFGIFEGKHEFVLDNITSIIGKNGAGKSTIAKYGLFFVLYGYTDKTLQELPTRGQSESCEVTVFLEDKNNKFKITRKYPTEIEIEQNEKVLNFANNTEAKTFLNEHFNDIQYFQRFRMIDNNYGINILEEGSTKLKKILLSFSEDIFNNARQDLLDIKRERNKYNKNNLNTYTHYPSEYRLNAIEMGLQKINNIKNKFSNKIRGLESEYYTNNNKKGKVEGRKNTINYQKNQLLKADICYACKRDLDETTVNKLLEKKNKELKDLNNKLASFCDLIQDLEEIIEQTKNKREVYIEHNEKLNNLKMKLKSRLQQKDFIYTDEDIEVVKEAKNELDNLYAQYLIEWVRNLEPIINDVIERIGFQIKFDLNNKGDFDFILYRNDQEFKYKDLSDGEKLILSTAFKLALLLDMGESGLVIADEGFSSLDEDNLNHIIKLFEELPFQLIMVIHNVDEFPEGVKVIKL